MPGTLDIWFDEDPVASALFRWGTILADPDEGGPRAVWSVERYLGDDRSDELLGLYGSSVRTVAELFLEHRVPMSADLVDWAAGEVAAGRLDDWRPRLIVIDDRPLLALAREFASASVVATLAHGRHVFAWVPTSGTEVRLRVRAGIRAKEQGWHKAD